MSLSFHASSQPFLVIHPSFKANNMEGELKVAVLLLMVSWVLFQAPVRLCPHLLFP